MSQPCRGGPRRTDQHESADQPLFQPLRPVGLDDIEQWHSVEQRADASRLTSYEARMGPDVRGTWPNQVVDFTAGRLNPLAEQQTKKLGGESDHRCTASGVVAHNAWLPGAGRSQNQFRAGAPTLQGGAPLPVPFSQPGRRPGEIERRQPDRV